MLANAKEKQINVVFIGNSITYGAGLPQPTKEAPPVKAAAWLATQSGIGSVKFSNQGVSGATTVDFLPETHTLFPKVIQAADQFQGETWAQLLFSVMLGTNDCKAAYGASAEMIGKGIEKIVGQIRGGAPDSKILLISPIWLGEKVWKPGYDPEFSEKSVAVSKHLAKVYRQIAEKENIAFLNAAAYAKPSAADQEHMDPENHRLLAEAIYQKVIEIEGILE